MKIVFVTSLLLYMPLAFAQTQILDMFESDSCSKDYVSEVSFSNGLIYSQEYMRYFFADYDSDKQPYPAQAYFFTTEVNIHKGLHALGSISFPYRDEELRSKGESTRYYYPKLLVLGGAWNAFSVRFSKSACIEHQIMAGLNSPLSHRFADFVVPMVGFRLRVNITENSGMNFGLGYSGNISRGAFFVPFGFGYRI